MTRTYEDGYNAGLATAMRLIEEVGGDTASTLMAGLEASRLPQTTTPREHDWYFYANGTFCRRCGAAIGSGVPCR